MPSDHLGGQLEADEASRAGLGQQQRPPLEQRIPVVSHGRPQQARVRRLPRVGLGLELGLGLGLGLG